MRRGSPAAALLAAAVLCASVAAVYLPTLGHGFVFDDDQYVTANPDLRLPAARGFARAFTSTRASNWHPLTWLSHMLDYRLFGLRPRGHHLVNLLLHAANSALLFLLLRGMTGALAPAALAAALFALHPLHVESVAWVAERKDLLSTLLALLALGAWLRYVRRPSAGRWLAAALLFALGLAAKPMLVTLPLLMLLLDWWPLGRAAASPRRLLAEKLPLLLLSALSSLVTLAAQRRGGALQNLDVFPLPVRATNALVSWVAYVLKALWPAGLAVWYPHPRSGLPAWEWLGSGALLAAATIFFLGRARRRAPWAAVGWLWYLVSLVPVIGLVQVGAQAMADRYTYLPLTGLFVAAAWGAAALAGRRPRLRAALAAVACAWLLGLALASRHQLSFWKDDLSLYSRAMAVTRDNWMMANNLGVALKRAGRLAEAEASFREALRVRPGYDSVLVNLGNLAGNRGRNEEARRYYLEAVRRGSRLPELYNNLGSLFLREGRPQEAVRWLEMALRLREDFFMAHFNLGAALETLGRAQEAVRHYRRAAALNPEDPAPRARLEALGLRD